MSARGPRVSIGLPVYNGARFLPTTIDSILAQTFTDWELVVSDNASTDATSTICGDYASRDHRIRYLRNDTNLGLVRNFNRTVELAAGEYFKLWNADDLCEASLLAKAVRVLDEHPQVALCYGRTVLIDEKGAHLAPFIDGLDLRECTPHERFWLALERTRMVNVLQGVIRTDALRRTGLLKGYVGSDIVLVAELALHGQFYELPEQLFFRRIHAGAFSSLASETLEREFLDPRSHASVGLYYWRQYVECVRAIRRAPLALSERWRLSRAMTRRIVSARKTLWRELAGVLLHFFRS